ncbi:MAG: hypothetical protein KBG82_05470 [Spirochaetes bacterium]|nr:hypothetical protein [Spirochaetota bacterium]HOV46073.1 MG2 domain-containing protein [Exilispira sp.]
MKNQKVLLCIFIIFISLFLLNCAYHQNKEISPIKYSENISKVINASTSGIISPDAPIVVVFQKKIVDESILDKPIKNEYFTFSPSVDGKMIWKDTNTLAFIADKPFNDDTIYTGTLQLKDLTGDSEPFVFRFLSKKPYIKYFKSEFICQDTQDPQSVVFQGTVGFSQSVDARDIEPYLKLKCGSKSYDLKIMAEDLKTNSFSFSSDKIQRDAADKKCTFIFNPKSNKVYESFNKKVILYSSKSFKPVGYSTETLKNKTFLVATFTNEIDESQDFRGFVSVSPDLDFSCYSSGNKLYISGDFQNGETYKLDIHKGIKSKFKGVSLNDEYTKSLSIDNLKPSVAFTSNGIFLPTDNNKCLRFTTVNLKSVRCVIIKVYDNNLCQFVQEENLKNSDKNRKYSFSSLNKVGTEVYNEALNLNSDVNVSTQHELDLSRIIKSESGLYVVSFFYNKQDILTQEENDEEDEYDEWDEYGDYYDEHHDEQDEEEQYEPGEYVGKVNAKNNDYYSLVYNSYGQVHKAVSVSDIGIIYQKTKDSIFIYTTDIITTNPLEGVDVSLYTYQNQFIASGKTDKSGKIIFKYSDNPFFIKAEKGNQRSFISTNQMALNFTNYDIGGVEISPKQLRLFAYSERGIYRPGDEINITAIVRNQFNTFETNHPVTIKVYNPRNSLCYEQINKSGVDGVYVFNIQTSTNDLTGTWNAYFEVAGEKFIFPIKIESIVPYTIKVNVTASKEKLSEKDNKIELSVNAKYLAGLPASGLKYIVYADLNVSSKKFTNFPTYNFDDKTFRMENRSEGVIASGTLDNDGNATVDWSLPRFDTKPPALNVVFTVRVVEKSGRPVPSKLIIPVDTYDYYVGYKLPSTYSRYSKTGEILPISLINLKANGEVAKGRKIEYNIYFSDWWWWWDYYYDDDFSLNFKSRSSTLNYKKGSLISKEPPMSLDIKFDKSGTYLVEFEEEDGHRSSVFVFVYGWGMQSSSKDASYLLLKSNKNEYNPGETAKLSFPSTKNGKVFVTVEHGEDILSSFWLDATSDKNDEMTISIPINKEMVPNVYCTILLIQPHGETKNDRPIRMYGVIPLKVTDLSTKQEIEITTNESFKPNQPFSIEIKTKDSKPAQVTVAVVDEGLLDITSFKTPDPWENFNKKIMKKVFYADIFDSIINLNTGEVKNRFAVGGDELLAFRSSQAPDQQAMRFKPVSFFKGPFKTDEKGYAKVTFDMPNYIGSVRIMVVSISGNNYGSAEKAVPVKENLMVSASLPRVLRPGDRAVVPITILGMVPNLGKISINAQIKGPANITDGTSREVVLTKEGEQTVYYTIEANMEIGMINFEVKATNGKFSSYQKIEMDILAGSARKFVSEETTVSGGKTKKLNLPKVGYDGSNKATITVSSCLPAGVQEKLSWLIHYPYGCIEQTISSVFPQLYLKEIISLEPVEREKVDYFIKAAINKLRNFQLSDGSFSYWPSQSYSNLWATNYAGHFLLEAKNRGYAVPDDMLNNWINYQKKAIKSLKKSQLRENIYSLYLLSLSGNPQIGSMNIIWEYYANKLSELETWMLAASYKLAGASSIAENILKTPKFVDLKYDSTDETFGSKIRDDAMILNFMLILNRDEEASKMFTELVKVLSKDSWYSTQETGFLLLGIGKFLVEKGATLFASNKVPNFSGLITLPSGKKYSFSGSKYSYSFEINSDFGKDISIFLDPKSDSQICFVSLVSSGIPLFSSMVPKSEGLNLDVEYFDEFGKPILNKIFEKGKVYYIRFTVQNNKSYGIRNLALVHLIPAGLEYDIERIKFDNKPEWDDSDWEFIKPEYVDIRDDRAFIFFHSFYYYPVVFYLKVNSVTAGKFAAPGTYVEAMYDRSIYASTAFSMIEVSQYSASTNPLSKPKN